jgi:MFS family permease
MNETKTPFGRLLFGIILGQFGNIMTYVIPLALLLTFKFLEIDPQNLTTDFSLAAGISGILAIVSSYVAGAISDRTTLFLGRRRTWTVISAVGSAASLMGIAMSKSVILVVVFFCILTICYNFGNTCYTALIPDQIEEKRRGTASGINGLVSPLGILFGMILMTALNNFSLNMKFGLLSIIVLAGGFIAAFIIKDPPIKEYKSAKDSITISEKISKIYPSPRKYPYFSWGVLTRFLLAIAYSSQSYQSIYLMQKFNIPQEQVTGIATTITIFSTIALCLSSIIGGALSDKFRKQKPFVSGSAVIVAIGVFSLAFATNITVVIIGATVVGFGYGMFLSVDMALIARILPNKEDVAKDIGIANVGTNLPGSIVPVFAPTLIATGGFTLLYGVLAAAGLLSAASVVPIPEMSSVSIEEAALE